ncbi:hypothetical protein QVD17_30551 [Tagetes erecta]|uniref:Uncharacterized protein n=1 Tax=Tagetes erecta TaxID=13708 RepID=A0AAD8K5U5_TARER|nr:hypothetical protein QVD17_30551 [Tagetes erecta]
MFITSAGDFWLSTIGVSPNGGLNSNFGSVCGCLAQANVVVVLQILRSVTMLVLLLFGGYLFGTYQLLFGCWISDPLCQCSSLCVGDSTLIIVVTVGIEI